MTLLDEPIEVRETAAIVRSEPRTYEQHGTHSFFLDMARAKVYRDEASMQRLVRHQHEHRVEQRVNPNTTAGTGGEFDPPGWLIDDAHVKYASRAGRTFADLLNPQLLPAGIASVHVPKMAGGFTDDIQSAQGEPDVSTDMTSSDINQSQIVTLAGEAEVSQQLLDLSPFGFDRWAYMDLHLDYNAKLENDLINGTGSNGQMLGIANFSIPTANTVSGASATTVQAQWPLFGQAAAAVGNGRLLQPEVWLMAPRRWFWIASSVDNSNRPIASPHTGSDAATLRAAGGYPPIGNIDGLPVYLSGAITAGSSADNAYCVRPADMALFESVERYSVIVNALSGTLQVRLQLHRYCAFIGNVYTSGLGVVKALPQPSNF